MVVSKDLDSSEHIFSIVQRFYHYLPNSEKEVLKTLASNRKELKFEEPHGGRIVVETAGKTSAGHSFTVRHLLLSEVSRWPEDCEDTIIGLMNAVPRQPETCVIIESVANGMSGWFYQEWHKTNSDYEKIFLPWFEHTEYQKELPCDAKAYELTGEEQELIDLYGLTLQQVEWRRWAIRNNCQDNVERFKEQYPASAQEAFIASGSTFFHTPSLDAVRVSDPLRCDLRVVENLSGQEEIRPEPNPRGWIYLWKRPQANRHYVIGCDIAEGIEIDGAPADDRHDYTCGDVIDRNTGEQVAQIHGKITPDEFGRQLAVLGRWYNWAYIGPETNAGYGNHVIDVLQRESYPAHLIYRRQVTDETTRKTTNKLGWHTTQSNRRSMMSVLDMAIRNKELLLNSFETVRELRSFITKPNGRIEAGSGNKDDRVFSLAISYQILAAAPAADLWSAREDGEPDAASSVRTYHPRNIYRRHSQAIH